MSIGPRPLFAPARGARGNYGLSSPGAGAGAVGPVGTRAGAPGSGAPPGPQPGPSGQALPGPESQGTSAYPPPAGAQPWGRWLLAPGRAGPGPRQGAPYPPQGVKAVPTPGYAHGGGLFQGAQAAVV